MDVAERAGAKEAEMKRVFGSASISMVAGAAMLAAAPAPVDAGSFLGEFCWDVTFTEPAGAGGIVRAAVTDMGNGHYFLNGMATNAEGDAIATHGNAELNGGEILVTGVASFVDSSIMWTATSNWVLDAATLSGTITRIRTVYRFGTQSFTDDEFFDTGAVTPVACPDPSP